MFFLKVIRNQSNLVDGIMQRRVILFVRNKSPIVVKKMLSLLKTNQMLEGDDQVIMQNKGNTIKEYRVCIICCKNAQQKNRHICQACFIKHINRKTENGLPIPNPGLISNLIGAENSEIHSPNINSNASPYSTFYRYYQAGENQNGALEDYRSPNFQY